MRSGFPRPGLYTIPGGGFRRVSAGTLYLKTKGADVARVIDTPVGALLTSPMNAHTLSRGDQVVIGTEDVGYAVLTVSDNRIPVGEPGSRWIEFETATAPNVAGCGARTGGGFGIKYDANDPLNRVTGGRSSAGGSHS